MRQSGLDEARRVLAKTPEHTLTVFLRRSSLQQIVDTLAKLEALQSAHLAQVEITCILVDGGGSRSEEPPPATR